MRGAALSENEEQLRLVVNAVPTLIAYVDTEARYVWANETYRRWFGYSPEQIRGLHGREVLGPDAWAAIQPYVRRVLAGEAITFDHRVVYKTGPARNVRASYTPHLDRQGRVRGFVAMVSDITETRAAELALRRSEQMLERSQSSAHVGSWEVTLAAGKGERAGAVHWSHETYRMLGYEPGGVEVTDAGFMAHIHPDDRNPVCADWLPRIERGEPFESDFRIVRPDGTVRLIHTWTDFQHDAAGKPLRMVGTCQDITERKQAEAGAARGRPPQGRVPGHAGPRAAQPPGPDPQRPAS